MSDQLRGGRREPRGGEVGSAQLARTARGHETAPSVEHEPGREAPVAGAADRVPFRVLTDPAPATRTRATHPNEGSAQRKASSVGSDFTALPDVTHDVVDGELLLETSDVAWLLGLSGSRVKALADSGELEVFGRTRRKVRIFRIPTVAAFKAAREAAKREQ